MLGNVVMSDDICLIGDVFRLLRYFLFIDETFEINQVRQIKPVRSDTFPSAVGNFLTFFWPHQARRLLRALHSVFPHCLSLP